MRFLRAFDESFCQAVDYYGGIDGKIASRFVDAVERAQMEIIRFPKIGKSVKSYRVLLLKEFPYSLCYYENPPGELVGLVLFHHKQKDPRPD